MEDVSAVGNKVLTEEERQRMQLYALWDHHDGGNPSHFLESLAECVEKRVWEGLGLSLKDFVTLPPPEGLGFSLDQFERLYKLPHRKEKDVPSARRRYTAMRDAIERLLKEEEPTLPKHGAVGRGRDYDISSPPPKLHGTSAEYTLRRLKRDRPDLAEKVISGEMTANAAALEAGFRKRTKPFYPDDVERTATIMREYFDPDVLYAAMVKGVAEGKTPRRPPTAATVPDAPSAPKEAPPTAPDEDCVEALAERGEKKYKQLLERLERTKAKGVHAEYTAAQLVELGRDNWHPEDVFIIADTDDIEAMRSVLMLDASPKSYGFGYLAAFGFFELADVYMYRLREKEIISSDMRIVRIQNYKDSEEFAQLEKRVGIRTEVCGCRHEDSYRAAYNVIETSYTTQKVGWRVLEGVRSSEDVLREEQEATAKAIRDFYAQEGNWIHVSTHEEADTVLDSVEETRGRIELRWVDEEAKYHRIHHTAAQIDAINSRRVIVSGSPPEYGFALGHGDKVVPRDEAANVLIAACSEHPVLLEENKHPY